MCAICMCVVHVPTPRSGDSAPVAVVCRADACIAADGCELRCSRFCNCLANASCSRGTMCYILLLITTSIGSRAILCHTLMESTSGRPQLQPAAPCSETIPERLFTPFLHALQHHALNQFPGCSPHLPSLLALDWNSHTVFTCPFCACPAAPCTGTTGTGLKR